MKPVMVVWLAVSCLMLAACSGGSIQFPVTSRPAATTNPTANSGALNPPGAAVSYEIVASGDPAVGAGRTSVTSAWRSGSATPAALAAFPDEAQTTLQQLPAQSGSDLYLAIYGGVQPSSGYEVKIVSIDKHDGGLQVTYQVAGPPPGQGAASVMTHPYVIVRLADTTTQPADVSFVEQPVAR